MHASKCWPGRFPPCWSRCSPNRLCRKTCRREQSAGWRPERSFKFGTSWDTRCRSSRAGSNCATGSANASARRCFSSRRRALTHLPHGEGGEEIGEIQSRAELEERLQTEFDDFARGGPPFGVLWIGVDQAEELRKTHGTALATRCSTRCGGAIARVAPRRRDGRLGRRRVPGDGARAQRGDAAVSRANAGRAGAHRGLPLVGRPHLAHGEHRRGAGRQRCTRKQLAQLLQRARQAMETSSQRAGTATTVAAASRITAAAGGSDMFAIIGIVRCLRRDHRAAS